MQLARGIRDSETDGSTLKIDVLYFLFCYFSLRNATQAQKNVSGCELRLKIVYFTFCFAISLYAMPHKRKKEKRDCRDYANGRVVAQGQLHRALANEEVTWRPPRSLAEQMEQNSIEIFRHLLLAHLIAKWCLHILFTNAYTSEILNYPPFIIIDYTVNKLNY